MYRLVHLLKDGEERTLGVFDTLVEAEFAKREYFDKLTLIHKVYIDEE